MRLDKFLGQTTTYSRSQAKDLLKAGRIKVNSQLAKKGDQKIKEDQDQVTLDGQVLSYSRYQYLMLNKPAGVVSARTDKDHATVLDLLEAQYQDLFPVGRLDKDTEGLLVLTNDGQLAHDLLSPKKHVDKTYYVELASPLQGDEGDKFQAGLALSDFVAKPARLVELSLTSCQVTIQEGKFHQVKRMFKAVNNEVTYLKRLTMGGLTLDDTLAPGQYRPLGAAELLLLQEKSVSVETEN